MDDDAIKRPCPECDGEGGRSVDSWGSTTDLEPPQVWEDCEPCEGTGQVWVEAEAEAA